MASKLLLDFVPILHLAYNIVHSGTSRNFWLVLKVTKFLSLLACEILERRTQGPQAVMCHFEELAIIWLSWFCGLMCDVQMVRSIESLTVPLLGDFRKAGADDNGFLVVRKQCPHEAPRLPHQLLSSKHTELECPVPIGKQRSKRKKKGSPEAE